MRSAFSAMGGANGSRECAPDDKLRDTHQLHLMEMMGFAGSTHPYLSRAEFGVIARLAAKLPIDRNFTSVPVIAAKIELLAVKP
jgi:hypothetical protein